MGADSTKKLIEAADNMDWQQVVLNGGPPCFFLQDKRSGHDGRFCGRAERWQGHSADSDWPNHAFVSLADLLEEVRK